LPNPESRKSIAHRVRSYIAEASSRTTTVA
jgi:hypothetical protein